MDQWMKNPVVKRWTLVAVIVLAIFLFFVVVDGCSKPKKISSTAPYLIDGIEDAVPHICPDGWTLRGVFWGDPGPEASGVLLKGEKEFKVPGTPYFELCSKTI